MNDASLIFSFNVHFNIQRGHRVLINKDLFEIVMNRQKDTEIELQPVLQSSFSGKRVLQFFSCR